MLNNPYIASFEDMRSLYIDYHRRQTRERYDNLTLTFTREEIANQMRSGQGEVMQIINEAVSRGARRTEPTEFILALQLADFYFPNVPKEVGFDLRRGVNPASITTFEELLAGFEDHTHIDCIVRSEDREISFQLKRYMGASEPDAFVDWLNTRVLRHYGDMSGTALIVLLQPRDNTQSPLALDVLYELFTQRALPNVTFDSVSLLYNDAQAGYIALHELYPKHHRRLIDINLMMARMRDDV